MSAVDGTPLPLKDGQEFTDSQGRHNKVMGDIRTSGGITVQTEQSEKKYDPTICWTLQGRWYRRADGVEMTGGGPKPMTIQEFYKWRRTGGSDG